MFRYGCRPERRIDREYNPRVKAESASNQFLQQPTCLRDVQEFARPHHVHRLVNLTIEVPGCRVHGDDEFGVCDKRALEETVVGFVPDYAELGQRVAYGKVSTISATNSG